MARDYSFPFMKTTGLVCIKESIMRHTQNMQTCASARGMIEFCLAQSLG
jgi:hypothetical protein